MPLMNTPPLSMRRASATARSSSRVQMLPPRPKSELLAAASASSAEPTRITAASGPKVSSRNAGMSRRAPGQHGRRDEVAAPLGPAAAAAQRRAGGDDLAKLALEGVAQVAARQRPHGHRLAQRVTDDHLAGLGDEAVLELGGDGVHDDEALGGDAALPGVLEPRLGGGARGRLEVGVLEDDEGVRSTELENRALEAAARRRPDAATGGGAARSASPRRSAGPR